MYCSLYEVVEKSRSGSHLEGLLQKLEKEKLVSATDLTILFLKIILLVSNLRHTTRSTISLEFFSWHILKYQGTSLPKTEVSSQEEYSL